MSHGKWEEEYSDLDDDDSEWEDAEKEDSELEEDPEDIIEEDDEDNWRFKMQQLRKRGDWESICHEDGGYASNDCEDDCNVELSDEELSDEELSDEEQSDENGSDEEQSDEDGSEEEARNKGKHLMRDGVEDQVSITSRQKAGLQSVFIREKKEWQRKQP